MFKELLSVRASLKSGKADQALAELEAVLGPMALADLDSQLVSNTMAEAANKSAQSMMRLPISFELFQAPAEEVKRHFEKLAKQASEAGEKLRKDLAQGLGSSGRFEVHSVLIGPNKTTVGFVGGGGGAGFAGASAGSGMPETERTPYQKMLDKIANAPKAVKGAPVMVNMKLARVKLKRFAELNNCSTLEQAVQLMGFKSWISSPFINTLSLNYVATPYGEHLSTFLGEEIITNKITGQQARS